MAPRIVLASGSPRRLQLLETLGFDVTAVRPDVDEEAFPDEPTAQVLRRVAMLKCRTVRDSVDGNRRRWPIIAADTIVEHDGERIGKPDDRRHAMSILRRLAGHRHHVHTGFCVHTDGGEHVEVVTTEVLLRPLSAREIRAYVETGEADDKAGAYGIQERGAALVDTIVGSYSNVVGLPLMEVLGALPG